LRGDPQTQEGTFQEIPRRVFFLHDGRSTNLVEAIRAHRSRGSEANMVIERFNKLSTQEQQEIIDFLRSL
jgi:CxxC motif-containing protein (DUF1111 family)